MGPMGRGIAVSSSYHSTENNLRHPPCAVIGTAGSPNFCPPRRMARGAKYHVPTEMGGECLLA